MNKRGGDAAPPQVIRAIVNAILPNSASDESRDKAYSRACYTLKNFNPPTFSHNIYALRDIIKNDIEGAHNPEQAAKAQHLCDILISNKMVHRKDSILRVLRGISSYERSKFGNVIPIPSMISQNTSGSGEENNLDGQGSLGGYPMGLERKIKIDEEKKMSSWGKEIREEKKERKLNEVKISVPNKIQEKQTGVTSELLCKDVVYTMQGVPGQYIFFRENENRVTDLPNRNNRGYLSKEDASSFSSSSSKDRGSFLQNTSIFPAIPLTQPQYAAVTRCAESGLLIAQKATGMRKVISEENGICGALLSAIEIEKANYLKIVSTLPNTVSIQCEEDKNNISSRPFHTLLTVAESWRPILAYLAALTEKALSSTANEIDLLSDLCLLCEHGDPTISTIMNRLFTAAIQPFMNAMKSWCLYGEILGYSKLLQGRYNNSGNNSLGSKPNETYNSTMPGSFFVKMSSESETDLWKSRYSFSNSLVPRFIPFDLAQDCYILGKSVSFLRNACKEFGYTIPSELLELSETHEIFSPDFTKRNMSIDIFVKKLRVFVDLALQSVTDAIMQTLFNKFNLRSHLSAIHCFLLLTRSDFSAELHDVIETFASDPDNNKDYGGNGFSIPKNRLVAALDGAIRKSSVSSMPKECLDNVDIDLRDISKIGQGQGFGNQRVYSSHSTVPFTLTYVVSPPLSTIITPEAIDIYELVFRRILSLQISEKTLNRIWAERMRMARLDHILSMSAEKTHKVKSEKYKMIFKELHKVSLLSYKMHYAVTSIINYAMTEVIHLSITNFSDNLSKAKSLGDVISAHERCVKDIGKRLLICTDKRRSAVIQERTGGTVDIKGSTESKILTEFGENLDNFNQLVFDFDVFCQHLFSRSEAEARHIEQTRIDYKDKVENAWVEEDSNMESPRPNNSIEAADFSIDGKVMGSEEIIQNTNMYTRRYNEITTKICNALTAASQLGSMVTGMEGECMEFLSSRLRDGMVDTDEGDKANISSMSDTGL